MDSRSRRNFGQLNNELQDVQRIMVQNIDDVLTRGEALSGTVTVCSKYRVAVVGFQWLVSVCSGLRMIINWKRFVSMCFYQQQAVKYALLEVMLICLLSGL